MYEVFITDGATGVAMPKAPPLTGITMIEPLLAVIQSPADRPPRLNGASLPMNPSGGTATKAMLAPSGDHSGITADLPP